MKSEPIERSYCEREVTVVFIVATAILLVYLIGFNILGESYLQFRHGRSPTVLDSIEGQLELSRTILETQQVTLYCLATPQPVDCPALIAQRQIATQTQLDLVNSQPTSPLQEFAGNVIDTPAKYTLIAIACAVLYSLIYLGNNTIQEFIYARLQNVDAEKSPHGHIMDVIITVSWILFDFTAYFVTVNSTVFGIDMVVYGAFGSVVTRLALIAYYSNRRGIRSSSITVSEPFTVVPLNG
jgi:hypothetical protein